MPFVVLSLYLLSPTHAFYLILAACLLQILRQSLLANGVKPFLNDADDTSVVPGVGILEVLSYPGLDICNFWERITSGLLTCVELRETNTEAELVNVRIRDNIVGGLRNRWVDKELNETLCGQSPTLGITVDECLGVAKGLCERDDSSLAISRSRKLLGLRKDDSQVNGLEDTMMG